MAQKMEAIGKKGTVTWDDGSDHEGVAKIHVRGGPEGIQFVEFEYVKNGLLSSGVLFGLWDRGFTQTFEINYLNNEYLESVEGYYDGASGYFQALQFKTNFRVSELIGYDKGTKFSLAIKGNTIIGFHGYLTSPITIPTIPKITSIGAYFKWMPPSRLEVKGSKGGQEWDDGADHEGVTKIHVRGGLEGIQYIKFDYVKSGQPIDGSVHGQSGNGFTQTFEINHLNKEYLVSIEGYYDDASGVIQALQFSTNMKTFELVGYEKGTKFSLSEKGKKIVGFHGYSEKNLNSLGAYFTTIPITKSECHGGIEGISWDDGVVGSMRRVKVYYDDTTFLRCVEFDYNNGRKVVRRKHGVYLGLKREFELDYQNEFITSVEGTFKSFSTTNMSVTSLIFKTSQGRTSPTFGNVSGTKFVLESKGCALVGFHGRSHGNSLVAFGAYFSPFPALSITEKLEAHGGDGEALWDDGAFDNVRKIYIGECENGIAFLKFVYDKDTRMVIGDDHGNKTPLDIKELELEYPNEYIIAMEGYYDKIVGSEIEAITMLRFKTNKRTSIHVGSGSGSRFLFYKEGYKIVGFHGKSSNVINQLGVHTVPIHPLIIS